MYKNTLCQTSNHFVLFCLWLQYIVANFWCDDISILKVIVRQRLYRDKQQNMILSTNDVDIYAEVVTLIFKDFHKYVFLSHCELICFFFILKSILFPSSPFAFQKIATKIIFLEWSNSARKLVECNFWKCIFAKCSQPMNSKLCIYILR